MKGESVVFNIGMGELIVVVIVALFVFGPGKLPQVARAAGKGVQEFRKAMHTVVDELQVDEIREVKRSVQSEIKEAADITADSKRSGGGNGTKA